MRARTPLIIALALLVALPALAQQEGRELERPRANQGHLPPPPPRRSDLHAQPEVHEREGGRANSMPHVTGDHWYGHAAPGDPRYRIAKPFERGRFEHAGPEYRYSILKVERDHHRFWFPGGFYFEVMDLDWPLFSDWCWDCGEDFVVYEDPDHVGWYLLYNVHTGAYVHVRYLGIEP